MSDHHRSTFHSLDDKAADSSNPSISSWMARWTRTSCEASPQMHNHISHLHGNMGDHGNIKHHFLLSGVEVSSDISRSDRVSREVETRSDKINENLASSSNKCSDERARDEPLTTLELCQESGRSYVRNNDRDTTALHTSKPVVSGERSLAASNSNTKAPPPTETPSREFHFQPEPVLQIPAEEVKYHMFFGESSNACTSSNKETGAGSASHSGLDRGKFKLDDSIVSAPFLKCTQEEMKPTPIFPPKEHMLKKNPKVLGQGRCNYPSHPAILPFFRHNYPDMLENDPPVSSRHSKSSGLQYNKMQNNLGIQFFPRQFTHDMTEPEKFFPGDCSLKSTPHFVHDIATTRICTTLDSAEVFATGLPRYSQTTHSLFITNHADINVCKDSQFLRGSKVSAQLKELTFDEFQGASPHFRHGQRGVQLKLLGSSSDSEEMQNAKVAGILREECSAESDSMNMEPTKEKSQFSGGSSSPSYKDDALLDPNLVLQAANAVIREKVGCKKRMVELPDINVELPALPVASSSVEKTEPCTSRTQSLDAESLHFNNDWSSNLKSNDWPEDPQRPEPGKRWLKRLKLSSSTAVALHSKSTNMNEVSSHESPSKHLGKNVIDSTGSSEQTRDKHCDEELTSPGHTMAIWRKGGSLLDKKREARDLTLSHAWIRRWCHNQGRKKPETAVTCDLERSKLELEDLQKKQFPSIAAMALMGKVLTGFPQCEFQKRGSFMVWNTKGF